MNNESRYVPFDMMEKFMIDVFVKVGVPEGDAKICADVLIDSHGISRLKSIYIDRIRAGIQNAVTEFEILCEGPTTAVIDGHNGMGHVIAKKSMLIAIEKAKKYGMGMTAVRNSTHYGIAGYYAAMAVEAGMIGVTGTNARPSVAPTFGIENMLGTNPLTFGIPTDEQFPFILDCATSLSQRGKIELYAREGKTLPAGWVIDQNGNTETDAKKVLEGLTKGTAALTPLGGKGEEGAGYKGYGYCTVVEILSAALQQGAFLKMLLGVENGRKVPINLGHFFIVIDISAFTELDKFKKTAGDILRSLRASKKAPGSDRIYTAGEKEYLVWQERKTQGIPINEELQKEIIALQKELNITGYKFPF